MDPDWITSPSARRILALWADPRPAWLWQGDGTALLWRNRAARQYAVSIAPDAPEDQAVRPIKGQVSRLIRLGIVGRSSPANLPFLSAGRPRSATCLCTPLPLRGGALALLIVATDPEARQPEGGQPYEESPFAPLDGGDGLYLLTGADGAVVGGSPDLSGDLPRPLVTAMARLAPGDRDELDLEGRAAEVLAFDGGAGHILWLVRPVAAGTAGPSTDTGPAHPAPPNAPQVQRPAVDLEPGEASEAPEGPSPPATPQDVSSPAPAAPAGRSVPEPEESRDRSLSTLFDRLAEDAELYRSLEDIPAGTGPDRPSFDRDEAELDEDFEEAGPPPASLPPESAARATEGPAALGIPEGLFRVTGRRFTPLEEHDTGSLPVAPIKGAPDSVPARGPEGGRLDRTSRYNFDELGRILADRIGPDGLTRGPGPEGTGPGTTEQVPPGPSGPVASEPPSDEAGPEAPDSGDGHAGQPAAPASQDLPPAEPEGPAAGTAPDRAAPRAPVPGQSQPEGQLVSLSGEPFILNRLPLGILVFRDQSVLFANRSITEMVGFASVEELRAAGLASIFPLAGNDLPDAGPVNHLVRRDGTLVPVTARLQSVSWQGRPALMLSASATEVRTGHEAAVRAFAEFSAEARDEGYLEIGRNGTIVRASARACALLEATQQDLVGKPMTAVISAEDVAAFRTFLDRPARFAETDRPAVSVGSLGHGARLTIYAQGQAGVVSGYFAIVRAAPAIRPAAPVPQASGDTDPAVLARISRGVRRPLNTIIGFADLIRSAAFGSVGNERYVRYAGDIRSAGEEIAALVEELDEYTRLREGRYATRPGTIDLAALLDSCVLRVRAQAGAARVLVRSAVSERLPRVRADRASLGQAVLNLLASAIDQTPPGGSVILSAQPGEDGTISINVRDSAAQGLEPAERFVVFRDGVGQDGRTLAPIRSSVGLALTQSLAEVNACSISVEPLGEGTLFTLLIPAENVVPPGR